MKRFVPIIAVMAVLLAGCGPFGKSTTKKSTPTGVTITTIPYQWPPQVASVTTDASKALGISAVQTDFATGWAANSPDPTTTPAGNVIDEAFVQCLFGTTPSPLTSYVVSPVFAASDGNSITQSFVRSVASTTQARTDFGNFTTGRVSSCEQAMYARQFSLPAGTKIIGKKFGFNPPEAIPANSFAPPDNSTDTISIRFLVSPSDAPATYEDVFGYGVGRFEVVELFQSSKTNPDSANEAKGLTAIKGRAKTSATAS